MGESTQEQQELMFKLSLYEQQIRSIQEQLQAIEQAVVETSSLKFDLDNLKNSIGKEVMASIGKGIFVKAKITEEDLIVDVGNKNFARKSISETQKIIDVQIGRLEKIREEMEERLQEINEELTKTFLDAQEKSKTN